MIFPNNQAQYKPYTKYGKYSGTNITLTPMPSSIDLNKNYDVRANNDNITIIKHILKRENSNTNVLENNDLKKTKVDVNDKIKDVINLLVNIKKPELKENKSCDVRINDNKSNIKFVKRINKLEEKPIENPVKVIIKIYEEHYYENDFGINFVKMVDDLIGSS